MRYLAIMFALLMGLAQPAAAQTNITHGAAANPNLPTNPWRCIGGRESADIWGFFDSADQGRYVEYCFWFRPDGTFTYSDNVDDAEGTWERKGDKITWKIKKTGGNPYTWDRVSRAVKGKIYDVVFDDSGKIVSHRKIDWVDDLNYTGTAWEHWKRG